MSNLDDIIKAGNLSFLKIASAKVFKSNEEYKLLVESLKEQLGDSHTRNTHVYIWESDDIPSDCSAIVMVRPSDAKKLKAAHERRKKLRGFTKTQLSKEAT